MPLQFKVSLQSRRTSSKLTNLAALKRKKKRPKPQQKLKLSVGQQRILSLSPRKPQISPKCNKNNKAFKEKRGIWIKRLKLGLLLFLRDKRSHKIPKPRI
jgi:hypothetical protein